MTDSKDHEQAVTDVIAEDVAAREANVYTASYIPYEGLSLNGACAKHDGQEFVGKSDYDELRQQLADTEASLKASRELSEAGLRNEQRLNKQLADVSNERDGLRESWMSEQKFRCELQQEIGSLKDRLNASEARNAEASELLERVYDQGDTDGLIGEDIANYFAQSAPATKPNLVECDACPTSSGCVNTCMKAPATDAQGEV